MHRNLSKSAEILDQTTAGVRQLLRDLVELAGQGNPAHTAPVLELQFGDVLTRTTLSADCRPPCLSILAMLPRSEELSLLPGSPGATAAAHRFEYLWHADEGRYVVMRDIPVEDFKDEPSVMDAILSTSELARTWFASACANASGAGP